MYTRVGQGFDIHRTEAGRPLLIGGVLVPADFGLAGHSDADVLLHAIVDALLGALAAGDIGQWFPDTAEEWRDADSSRLLRHVVHSPTMAGWSVVNLDSTIVAERPRLAPHIPDMRRTIADILKLQLPRVSVKAKTMEGIGAVGRGEAISAHAAVLVRRI